MPVRPHDSDQNAQLFLSSEILLEVFVLILHKSKVGINACWSFAQPFKEPLLGGSSQDLDTWFITMAIVSPLSRLSRVAPLSNGLLMAYKRGWSYLLTKWDDPPSGQPNAKGGWLWWTVFVSMGRIPSYAPQKPLRNKAFIKWISSPFSIRLTIKPFLTLGGGDGFWPHCKMCASSKWVLRRVSGWNFKRKKNTLKHVETIT